MIIGSNIFPGSVGGGPAAYGPPTNCVKSWNADMEEWTLTWTNNGPSEFFLEIANGNAHQTPYTDDDPINEPTATVVTSAPGADAQWWIRCQYPDDSWSGWVEFVE